MKQWKKSDWQKRLSRVLVLIAALGVFGLACRTADLLAGSQPAQVAEISPTVTRRAHTATRAPRTFTPVPSDTVEPPTDAPTDTPEPPPTDIPPTPVPAATRKPAPTRAPTSTPTPSGPTETPAPTRCPQQYCVVFRGCQPDGNTIVEGFVYNNGAPENGVAVRAAKAQGAYPEVDDYVSGTDPVNPGKPDPKHPGYYILQIAPGAARKGDWWIFVVDRPKGTKQISEAKLIQTDGEQTGGSCQHAYLDFVR